MKTCYVVAADGTRARFFSVTPATTGESGPTLTEQQTLVNPDHGMKGSDEWSSKPGRNITSNSGQAHGLDDHRERHQEEFERRFIHDVAHQAVELARAQQATRLIIAADKKTLGLLRDAINIPAHSGVEIQELAKDLSKLNASEIRAHLITAELLRA